MPTKNKSCCLHGVGDGTLLCPTKCGQFPFILEHWPSVDASDAKHLHPGAATVRAFNRPMRRDGPCVDRVANPTIDGPSDNNNNSTVEWAHQGQEGGGGGGRAYQGEIPSSPKRATLLCASLKSPFTGVWSAYIAWGGNRVGSGKGRTQGGNINKKIYN